MPPFARKHSSEDVALVDPTQHLTWAEVDETINRAASGLIDHCTTANRRVAASLSTFISMPPKRPTSLKTPEPNCYSSMLRRSTGASRRRLLLGWRPSWVGVLAIRESSNGVPGLGRCRPKTPILNALPSRR